MINKTECKSFASIHAPAAGETLSRFSSRLIWAIVLLMGLVVVVRFALALSLGGGSDDFHYYIVIAREWLRLPPGEAPHPAWMFYNPGIYRFYQALMLSGVTSSQGLSIAINSLNLWNALLITIILWRMKVQPVLSIWAGIWALFIAEHFSGFGGYTEPLVVLPMLLGVAVAANPAQPWWQGKSLFYVGAGLALSLYAKQQGSLFLVGAVFALVWTSDWRPRTWLRRTSLLASISIGIFLLLLAIEAGTLMEVLMSKINAVVSYPVRDASLWGSLGGKKAADPKLGFLLIELAAVLLCLRFFEAGKRWLVTPSGALFAVCLSMALASAWQVHTRPNKNYLLLTWPPLILAFTISGNIVLKHLFSSGWRRLAPCAMLLVVVFPFTRMDIGSYRGPWLSPEPTGVPVIDAYLATWGMVPYYEPWFFPKPTIIPKIGVPLRTYEVPAALQGALPYLRQDLPERTKVVVIPAQHTVFYWNLNVQHPLAEYGYPNEDSRYVRDLEFKQTQAVIIVTDNEDFLTKWVAQAQRAGFAQTKRHGAVTWLRR